MVQIIDYNELIKAQREGINQYYYQKDIYQTPYMSSRDVDAGFKAPTPERVSTFHTTQRSTPQQSQEFLKNNPGVRVADTLTPSGVLDSYFPGWQEYEAQRGQGYSFQGFEMPEMPEVTFESIYGMSEDEWKYQQEMKADLAQFEPAWAARESAITSATEAVDKMIRDQESYGALTGQDLTITDEARSTMIANMFADMYGEDQEQYIDTVINKYGLGDKYKKTIRRGQIGTFGQDDSLALTNRTGISGTVLTDNEDDLLGADVILG